ncbi:MAG: hypothetical protein ACI4V4_05285 [Eubacterium sp.]
MINKTELMSVNDIFENSELVLMKATFGNSLFKIIRTDVGLKNEDGDIVDIITVKAESGN